MATADKRELIERFMKALSERRFGDAVEFFSEDIVQEWPQSGERIKGVKNVLAVMANYPEMPSVNLKRVHGSEDQWVLTPTWTPLRITGTGDTYTVELRIHYPNGEVWSGVSILEFRNDKVSRQTEYFAAPFPAAEWRSRWVEKMESHK
jgi:hypothetical protein